MSKDVFEEELERPSIFKNESKLSIDYVPPSLPHREKELRMLVRTFKILLEKPGSKSCKILISGSVGTGKTALAKLFGKLISNEAQQRGINLHYIHINCRRDKTEFLVLKRIVHYFNPSFPTRGFSPEELLFALQKTLDNREAFLLITLDELDFYIKKSGPELLYDLTRLYEEKLNAMQRISLIGIAKDISWMGLIDSSTLSTLQQNVLYLARYTASQLRDILEMRVKEAFYEGCVSEEAIDLIADIAAEWGDARYSLELLWRAGKYAEAEGEFRVLPEHVRQANAEIHPVIRKEILLDLPQHHRLLLLALARKLKKNEKAYATMGEIEELYHVICEEYGENPRGHTQIWNYIHDLESCGIINIKPSGPGIRGKTTLISLPDVPTTLLEKELMSLL